MYFNALNLYLLQVYNLELQNAFLYLCHIVALFQEGKYTIIILTPVKKQESYCPDLANQHYAPCVHQA